MKGQQPAEIRTESDTLHLNCKPVADHATDDEETYLCKLYNNYMSSHKRKCDLF